jgi:AhpC/TSA family protein
MLRTILITMAITLSGYSHALQVDNFVLLDHRGDAHELFYHRGAPAVVIMAYNQNCKAATDAIPALQSLQSKYNNQVEFWLLNSDANVDRKALAAHAEASGINLPILQDDTTLISESLQAQHAGEVMVLDPRTWQVAYRGPLPAEGQEATSVIADTLSALASGQTPEARSDTVTGCEITYPDRNQTATNSYTNTIAPLLQQKCVVCHTEGGLGPWAMNSYTMIQGFAPMIREVVRTKRMPPWHADPHIGQWKNDISLTTEETQQLIHWIEAGAPRGSGSDPLAANTVDQVEWPLGEPDLILEIPAYTVPVSGEVDYQFPTVKNPLDTGVWVKAATVVPGEREVVHHILAGTQDSDTTELRRTSGVFDNYLIGYAPGNESHEFPDGTGVYIPPGGEFLFQMHYTPIGREVVDQSRIGLYLHREVPENYFRQDVVVNPMIKIPPNTARHTEVAYYAFDKPATLHNLVPHAHYRGVASRFELWKPDGEKEIILNVPNYDFNWQRTYEFVVPKQIEAGTRLVHTTWYDNSAANPANPDASREVPWGLQSWDEMLYGAFSYTWVDESTEAPIHDKMMARTNQYVGFLDQNIDGKVSWRELPRSIKKQLVQGFSTVDTNGDGGLDLQEMHKLTERRAQQRREEAEAETTIQAGAG